MPEYSSTTITPSDGVQVPGMNGSTSGNFLLSALKSYILAEKGQANGLASLGSDGKLTAAQLPDLADDVIVVASYAVLPAAGTAGKIYITADNNKLYRWDPDLETPDYVELSVDLSAYATKAELAEEESARTAADSNLKSAIEDSEQRIENLEQAVSGSLVQTNVLTDPPSMANVRTITSANTILPWALLNRVGARSVAWNQLANVAATVFGTRVNSYTFNANFSVRNQTYQQTTDTIKTVSGHKYLLRIKSDGSPNLRTAVAGIIPFIGELTISQGYETILTGDGSDSFFYFTQSDVSLGGNGNIYINFFDLTAMGEYDSGKTDAQNIAKFRAKFPASYYPYNAVEIIPLNPSAFKVVGWNKLNLARTKVDANYTADTLMNWDETKCYKGSGSNDGQPNYAVSADVSNGKITVTPTYQGYGLSFPVKVLPNTSYYLKGKMTKGNKLYFNIGLYGADGAYVQRVYFAYDSASPYEGSYTFTTPANVYWANICFTGSANTETVYEEVNFNISQSDSSKPLHDGVYEAYKETTLDTSFTSDYKYVNENCHDYSENVLVDGQKKREEHIVVGSVDLGTLIWTYSTGSKKFYATLNGQKNVAGSDVGNILCSSYLRTSAANLNDDPYNMCCASINGNEVQVKNLSKTGSDLVSGHASWLEGVIFNYELATPTTSLHNDPIPNFPCEDGTTITAITPQTDLVNAIDVPTTIAYMTKIGG